jgi:hypothetical protein
VTKAGGQNKVVSPDTSVISPTSSLSGPHDHSHDDGAHHEHSGLGPAGFAPDSVP